MYECQVPSALLAVVRDDEVCRRLMTTPGVGPVVALTYRATVDVPARFWKSKSVAAVFGLTCVKHQSGEVDWDGRISRPSRNMKLGFEANPSGNYMHRLNRLDRSHPEPSLSVLFEDRQFLKF